LRADHDTARRLASAVARTQLGTPVLEQLAVCHLLDVADEVHAAQRARLREQRTVLVAALRERLPHWRFVVPSGGMVLWCQLPGAFSSALAAESAALGLRLAAGPRFGTGHAFEDRLRLPYTQPPDVLTRAVDVLARAAAAVGAESCRGVAEDLVL
ncbi:MAG: PLP-dependent aminotransferase family protein, partial [Actinomycetota bacterium]|nr:PLP-dependent aminotransferase family protein [Actinomycetota bacterium]